ncbi:pullulanase [Paenibacillus tarimensis]
MKVAFNRMLGKRIGSIFLIAALLLSSIGISPAALAATEDPAPVLAGSLQTELGRGSDWDPRAAAINNSVTEQYTIPPDPDGGDPVPSEHIRIHYQRTAGDYDGFGLWLWNDVEAPSSDWPSGAIAFTAGKTDSYGAYIDVPLKDGAKQIGFLVVHRETGDKDGGDKSFTLLDGYKRLWIRQGDDNVYVSPYGEVPTGLISAEIVAERKVLLNFTMTDGIDESAFMDAVTMTDKNNDPVSITAAAVTSSSTVELTASFNLDQAPLNVAYAGRTVSAAAGWRLLDELYHYEGDDLGATYNAGNATLRLWAPQASAVVANVYDKEDAGEYIGSVNLVKGDKGVWSAEIMATALPGVTDLRGYFYQYEVTHNGVTKKVLDPYAKSLAVFTVDTTGTIDPGEDGTGKAAIVDLSVTDPESYGFADISGYEKREDAIIWEVHVRDFTSDPSIELSLNGERWGSYDAFARKLDYIKSLGVTHIQLLPVMAWYYGDETKMGGRELQYSTKDNEYNWGYDPHSYFAPDGAYSADPTDPELRLKELKRLIHAIHEAGMGVILDVVYTHMAKSDFLNDIVPNYYAFQDANGNFLGGFGNNLATNRRMAEKLMVDSVKYWFEEYKIDGMRWDMMGDATYEAVQRAYDAAAEINPNALFIGEGWRTFAGHLSDPLLAGKGADQDWMDNTDSVGVFSDEFRNELKSGFGSEGQPMFLTGGARDINTIFNNMKGQPSNTPADDPGDMVQYIEAHDNLTLYDVIAQSIRKDPAVPANDLEIHKRLRLGNVMLLTSQGTAFLHAGQEYGRTKQWKAEGTPEHKYHVLEDETGTPFGYFVHDSYDSSDAINKFDWTKATDAELYPVNNETREYTAGLIKLRRSTDAFRLEDQALVDSNVTLIPAPEMMATDLIIGYKSKSTDGTGHYYVFVNSDSKARTLTLLEDLTDEKVIVDNDEAGTVEVTEKSGFTLTANALTLEPLTAVIIMKEAPAPVLTSLELDNTAYMLQAGTTHQAAVIAKYDDGSRRSVTRQAVYTSDNEAAASVTADGIMQAVSEGVAKITVSYGGLTATVTVTVTADPAVNKRYIQFNYIRPDKNYSDWNLWVWNTGAKNDQIDFTSFYNGMASALIEVAANATSVGFILRKGTNWDTAKQDIPDDRYIPLMPGESFTKVNVTSMVGEIDIVPSIGGPVIRDGSITFLYRDEELFRSGQWGAITDVKVKVGGTEYAMTYDASKEWFSYTLPGAEAGTYRYSFIVTKNGTTSEFPDPKNTGDGQSVVVLQKPSVTIHASVQPLTHNENAVLTVTPESAEEVAFRDAYIDLTALGGPAHVPLDPLLMKQTIAVKDNVPAGEKTITVTLVDQFGNRHTQGVKVYVKTRTYEGPLDFDWDEARIYFVLTDRFQDGDTLNNSAAVDKSHLEAYHGGDFRGLIEKLDYIRDLGINTLWITPIVDNIEFNVGEAWGKQYGYHGYWSKDFTTLEEHLGDLETFKELIDKAHDRGIKIMVDVVLNHTGYGLKPGDDRPGVTEADKARFEGMLRTDDVDAGTDPIRGELSGLPDFITEDPAVRERVIDWQAAWLERARTERGDTIDYFRVDTVKHVESTTWKAFKNALTEIDPSFKLIGEYFGATVDSDGGTLLSGQMDSLLDFGFKSKARDFASGSIEAVDDYLQDRESKLDNTRMMGQFLSSHDEDGFLSHYVDGDKGKLKIAAALQITAKGQPVVYYGEELGRSGANAGDMASGQLSENRGAMPWEKLAEEVELHSHYTKLLNIRAKFSKVYSKGQRTTLSASDGLGYLAFNKHYAGTDVVTIINTGTEAVDVTVSVPFAANARVTDEYSGKQYVVTSDRKVTVGLPGRDDGGTVILSLAVSVPPSGPSAPIPSSTTPASNEQVVTEASLKAPAVNGKIVLAFPQGMQSVILPLHAADLLGKSDLELTTENLSVTIPAGVLRAVKELVSAEEAAGAHIVFDALPVSAGVVDGLIAEYENGSLKLKASSDVYEFKLSIRKKDGTRIPVTDFIQPIAVSLKVKELSDIQLLGVYYLGENGRLDYAGGTVNGNRMTAGVRHFSKYAVLEYSKSFADVPASHWAYPVIKALAAKHIVTGVTSSQFKPGNHVSRAEFTALLVRALGLKAEGGTSFSDVSADAWYAPYVAAANHSGIVSGRSVRIFAPDATVTREEAAVMVIRALQVKKGQRISESVGAATAFTDEVKISPWALRNVNAAAELGLIRGRAAGRFVPQGTMTRAESAQLIYNLLAELE